MGRITCVDADGNAETFRWKREGNNLNDEITFRVLHLNPSSATGSPFELTVKPKDSHTVQLIMITDNENPLYKAKGIPDVLLPTVKLVLARDVESSPGRGKTSDVYRTVKSTAMWNRLVAKGLAVYCSRRDTYRLV